MVEEGKLCVMREPAGASGSYREGRRFALSALDWPMGSLTFA